MSQIWEMDNVNLFNMLCPHKFKDYASKHKFTNYSKDDYVYFQQDSANKVFLISSGKIKIGYYTNDGEEVIKAILGKGELFGEKSILGESKYNEFAKSLDKNTELCELKQETLFDLMKDNSTISLRIYKFIGIRLKKIERRLEILLFKDAKTRLVEFLSDLKEEYGTELLDGNHIVTHPYTQGDIAKLIGTSRPTLNVLLNELRQEKIINFGRKEITFYANVS